MSARALLMVACGSALLAPAAGSANPPLGFIDESRVEGLDHPVGFTFLPDGRILIVEQGTAAIRLAVNRVVSTLAVIPDVVSGGEQGLLGIAADPRWPLAPHVYVHYTHAGPPPAIHVSRYTLAGDLDHSGNGAMTLDLGSRFDLLTDIPNDDPIHNGGTVRFGPDSMLYVSLGDDGLGCVAQDSTKLYGKILRLDVSRLPAGPGGPADKALLAPPDNPFATHPSENARLVWAMGLRNPFRFHIDPATGHLFIADVGHNEWEEVDLADTSGLNFGWPWREGPAPLGVCGSRATSGFIEPIAAFDHSVMTVVISAGIYLRNGGAFEFPAEYEGDYFFSDYATEELFRLKDTGGIWSIAPPVIGQPSARAWASGLRGAADFAVGPDGALWYCSNVTDGRLRRIRNFYGTEEPPPEPEPVPEDAAYYDLQGRRVDDPTQNGLYFTRDGKKKIVIR